MAASIRAVVAPARPVVRAAPVERSDRAAEAVAAAFARAYLTLDGGHPDAVRDRLAALTGDASATALDADAPPIVRQRVRWVETVATRPLGHGQRLVTLAAETDRLGLRASGRDRQPVVRRVPCGSSGRPRSSAGPIIRDADAEPDARRPEVTDPALSEVVPPRAGATTSRAPATTWPPTSAASARVTLPDVGAASRAAARPALDAVRAHRWRRRSRPATATASATRCATSSTSSAPPTAGRSPPSAAIRPPDHAQGERPMRRPIRRDRARIVSIATALALALPAGLAAQGPAPAAAQVQAAPAPGAGGQGGGTSLEQAAEKARDTGRTVAISLLGLALAIAAVILLFKRDFKEAAAIFAVGLLGVLLATPAGLNALNDLVTSLFGAR